MVLRFQRLGKQSGDARCLFTFSVASGTDGDSTSSPNGARGNSSKCFHFC